MRASADDWLRTGLRLLRDGGADSLTVDALCRSLGRTKGSFYHHFVDLDAYQERLFAFWESSSTLGPIAEADLTEVGAKRRQRLYDAVARLELHVERAMQAWALRDPRARDARARVDARRLDYLARIWREEGATATMARSFATIEYAAFLGAIQLYDIGSKDGAREAKRVFAPLLAHLRQGIASAGQSKVVRARR